MTWKADIENDSEGRRYKKMEKKNERDIQELADTIRKSNTRIIGIPEGEEKKGTDCLFRQIDDENVRNQRNELELRIQEAKRIPNSLNQKRPSSRHTVLKLSKINDKERKSQDS